MRSETGEFEAGTPLRCPREEFICAVTHGIGLVLSIAGSILLLAAAAATGDLRCFAGCGFYTVTLVAVYATSTLSHLDLSRRLHRLCRCLDQGFIYLLIVGTLTPFALIFLKSPLWLGYFGLMLLGGFGGFLSKTVFAHRVNQTNIWLYLALAWGGSIIFLPLRGLLPTEAIYWVVAGGFCYTIGTLFLGLDHRRYHFHTIWHLLVMAGSACHFIAILRSVAEKA